MKESQSATAINLVIQSYASIHKRNLLKNTLYDQYGNLPTEIVNRIYSISQTCGNIFEFATVGIPRTPARYELDHRHTPYQNFNVIHTYQDYPDQGYISAIFYSFSSPSELWVFKSDWDISDREKLIYSIEDHKKTLIGTFYRLLYLGNPQTLNDNLRSKDLFVPLVLSSDVVLNRLTPRYQMHRMKDGRMKRLPIADTDTGDDYQIANNEIKQLEIDFQVGLNRN